MWVSRGYRSDAHSQLVREKNHITSWYPSLDFLCWSDKAHTIAWVSIHIYLVFKVHEQFSNCFVVTNDSNCTILANEVEYEIMQQTLLYIQIVHVCEYATSGFFHYMFFFRLTLCFTIVRFPNGKARNEVPEKSKTLVERWQKWEKKKPHTVVWAAHIRRWKKKRIAKIYLYYKCDMCNKMDIK